MVSKGGQVDVGGQAPKASVLYLLANSGLMADPCVLPPLAVLWAATYLS
jgi:hypothetical protein